MRIYRGEFGWHEDAKNDAITVIIPKNFSPGELVFTSGRSQASNGASLVDSGCIHRSTNSELKFIFPTNDYNFDATVSEDLRSLSLIMQRPGYGIHHPTTLYLAYESEVGGSPDIFVGNLDWYDPTTGASAINETFLFVAPEGVGDQKPACAFWRWTNGETKVNMDCIERIAATTEAVPNNQAFTFVHKDEYSFEGKLNEDGSKLSLAVTNAKGDAKRVLGLETFRFRSTANTASGIISIVRNDTPDPIVCRLYPSGTGDTDRPLAVLGLLAAGAGFLPLSVPASIGLGIFGVGLATAGLAQAFGVSAGQTSAVLFQNEQTGRIASGSLFPNNDASIMRLKIEGRYLHMSVYVSEQIGNRIKRVSQIPDSAFQRLLSLTLSGEGTQVLESYRLLVFRNMICSLVKEEEPVLRKGIYAVPMDRSLAPSFRGVWPFSNSEKTVFEYSQSEMVEFGYDAQSMTGYDYEILYLANGTPVLKLHNFHVEAASRTQLGHGFSSNKDNAIEFITIKSCYWAYGNDGTEFYAYRDGKMCRKSSSSSSFVYIVATETLPVILHKTV